MERTELFRRWSEKVDTSAGCDECWLWTAATQSKGYGVLGIGYPRVALAHRIAWALFRFEIPARTHVLHRCDTPPCVNPGHLWLGDDADNAADREMKGRGRRTLEGVARW